jgi:hypothetical protein
MLIYERKSKKNLVEYDLENEQKVEIDYKNV